MEGRWDEGEVGWRGGGMERGERYVHSSITINNVLHHDDNVHIGCKGTKKAADVCVPLVFKLTHWVSTVGLSYLAMQKPQDVRMEKTRRTIWHPTGR